MSTDTQEALADGFSAEFRHDGTVAIHHSGGGMHMASLSEAAMAREIVRTRAALATQPAQPETVTECEACFTPDVCQLRGTCDHYSAQKLRVAAQPAQPTVPAEWENYSRHLDARTAQPSAQGEAVATIEHTVGGSIQYAPLKAAYKLPMGVKFSLYASAPAAPAQAVPLSPALAMRAEALRLNAGMPWHQAEEAALSEVGIHDAEIDELIGECAPVGLDSLITGEDELRRFTRAVLVHGSGIKAAP